MATKHVFTVDPANQNTRWWDNLFCLVYRAPAWLKKLWYLDEVEAPSEEEARVTLAWCASLEGRSPTQPATAPHPLRYTVKGGLGQLVLA